MRHYLLMLCVSFALAAVCGCGAKKPVVAGLVTLDGQPLDNGTIQFFPIAGDGQTSAATIGPDGRYRMEASPTKMKVVIHATKVVGHRKAYEGQADSPMIDVVEDLLPIRYSDMNKTELRVDVVPGDNEKNFELHSDKKK
jgi:hypothetical protein